MKAGKKNNVLEVIKKEQLKRRVFTLDFKAEVVRHKKAENLSLAETKAVVVNCFSDC